MPTAAQRRQAQIQREHAAAIAAQRQRNTNATLAAGNSPFHPFKPYQAPNVPAGYYDPALDSQRQAATRGLDYTSQDIGEAGRRAAEDYGLPDANGAVKDYSTLATLGRGRTYENADYGHNVAMLTRQYQQLARQQSESARQHGITSGGLALLSAAKRQENQGITQGELDTAHTRALGGFDVQEHQATDLYNRGVADRSNTLGRARSEDVFYGKDVDAQKLYQAQQAGYEAPLRGEAGGIPRNEHIIASGAQTGTHTRTAVFGGYQYTYGPTGKIISKKRVR